jgi:uncharacterized protein
MTMRYSRYNVWAEAGTHHYVYTGTSGSFLALDPAERVRIDAFVAGEDDGAGLADVLTDLVKAGAIVTDDHDELEPLRRRYAIGRRHSGRLGLTIVTSMGCNFDCPYCFEDKQPALLGPEVAEAIMQLVEDSSEHLREVSVCWFGGEPLLASRQLFDLSTRLIERCDELGVAYQASIITNGWHLDADTARRLSEHRVRTAQVTIDGPPHIHDRYRPRVGGGSTFERIVDNLVESADLLPISVRVNCDRTSFAHVEELFEILAARGLAGRVGVSAGWLTGHVENEAAPLSTYGGCHFPKPEFADAELEFEVLARRYGFRTKALPSPVSGTPCTAVNATDVVVGAKGQLWKCWDDVGNDAAAIGTIFDYQHVSGGVAEWLEYDPFADAQCSTCVALPVCMGGCALLAMRSPNRDDQCGTFRFNHAARVAREAHRAEGLPDPQRVSRLDLASCPTSAAGSEESILVPVPVTIGRRPAVVGS